MTGNSEVILRDRFDDPSQIAVKGRPRCWRNIAIALIGLQKSETKTQACAIAFYEKVIKVKADVAAYLINCFPSAYLRW